MPSATVTIESSLIANVVTLRILLVVHFARGVNFRVTTKLFRFVGWSLWLTLLY